jgi:hypothetical protein
MSLKLGELEVLDYEADLPRMDSNHDKVIQSHLCYRYTTRQKGGKLGYHIVGKSQAKRMTDDRSQMTNRDERHAGCAVTARSHSLCTICHLLSVIAAPTAQPC